jgi:hypothetical protein
MQAAIALLVILAATYAAPAQSITFDIFDRAVDPHTILSMRQFPNATQE